MKLDIKINFLSGYDAITKKDTKAKGEKNDCVVRAIMNAFGVTYNEAHKICEKQFGRARKKGTMGTYATLINMSEGKVPTINKKKVVYLGAHPKLHGKKTLLNKQYPIIKKQLGKDGEEVKVSTFAGYTVGKFIQQNQKGTFFILVSGHALAVKDGVMLDNPNHNDDLLAVQLRDQRRCLHIFQVK